MPESSSAGEVFAGLRVVELAGGVAGAYCAKLFADFGASVMRLEPAAGDPLRHRREVPDDPATEGLYFAYLNAGKGALAGSAADDEIAASDLLIVGEHWDGGRPATRPRRATVELGWFPKRDWRGSDLIAQALSGMVHPVGPAEGPPQQQGDAQSAIVGGVTAYIAAMTGLLAKGGHRHFEVSIVEAVLVLSEYQMAFAETLDRPVRRVGINRFEPSCPVSIHPCREGMLGITVFTPAQWEAFCELIELPELGRDPELATSALRIEHVERFEPLVAERLRQRTAAEWAAAGRERRIPLVVVPDALGILEHPAFRERRSLATVSVDGRRLAVPRTPFRLTLTPPRRELGAAPAAGVVALAVPAGEEADDAPLAGLSVADFSMGWAGPLATRILADLGAEVVKIEAGRYPDWWRSVEWTPEAIACHQYEESRHFAALNRGKKSVSLDLTTAEGLSLARRLAAKSDLVVENQAAGVMPRLGLGYDDIRTERADTIMLSMSAFGSGNPWSDTRAYGSTLEQGSGLPSFCGAPDWPPTLGHVGYGDAIGGVNGCAALLTALYHRRRTGEGQWINLSQIECMLPFTTPALLVRGATGREPERRRNRHVEMVPHGIYPGKGTDRWIAIAVDGAAPWRALAETIGREDWRSLDAAARRAREDEIDAAIARWTTTQDIFEAAALLQAQGVIAAPVLHPGEVAAEPHLVADSFFHDTERAYVGRQRQAGLAIREAGRRYSLRGVAPFLGADSRAILTGRLGLDEARVEALLADGVVSLQPTALRG